jgi:hypothetical protein
MKIQNKLFLDVMDYSTTINYINARLLWGHAVV